MNSQGIAKLSDFGVSHIFDDDGSLEKKCAESYYHNNRGTSPLLLTRQDTDKALKMRTMCNDGLITKTEGTWAFWSPEMCDGGKAFSGYAADMWAAGVCLYVFVTGKLPFFAEFPVDLMEIIKTENVPFDNLGLSDSILDLLKLALHKDPTMRAGVGDCLQHPFLQRARAQRIETLCVEFAKSKITNTTVNDSDIKAVRCWFED